MTLADAKRNAQAIDHGQKLVSRLPQDPDSHLALAYVYQLSGQPFAALSQATTAYGQAPGKKYVVGAYIFALQNARLPHAALRVAAASRRDNTRPDSFFAGRRGGAVDQGGRHTRPWTR